VLVDLDAFDVWRDGRCVLSASWRILERDGGAVVSAGHGVFTSPPGGAAALPGDATVVAAMAHAVDELAAALAVGLRAPPVPDPAAGDPDPPGRSAGSSPPP
jgi:uncharacterized lipoprotein YmbA